VITTRPAMNDKGGGTFDHSGAFRHQAHAFNIEVDFRTANAGAHAAAFRKARRGPPRRAR